MGQPGSGVAAIVGLLFRTRLPLFLDSSLWSASSVALLPEAECVYAAVAVARQAPWLQSHDAGPSVPRRSRQVVVLVPTIPKNVEVLLFGDPKAIEEEVVHEILTKVRPGVKSGECGELGITTGLVVHQLLSPFPVLGSLEVSIEGLSLRDHHGR